MSIICSCGSSEPNQPPKTDGYIRKVAVAEEHRDKDFQGVRDACRFCHNCKKCDVPRAYKIFEEARLAAGIPVDPLKAKKHKDTKKNKPDE